MLRREFLRLVATGVAGLGASWAKFGKLIPFMQASDQVLPGVSTWYATSCRECPAGCGLLARNREARATKAEGNPLHPINAGRLCARGQAAIQGLYDPDRMRQPLRRSGRRETGIGWDAALAEIGKALAPLRGSGAVAVISDLQTGSLAALIRQWLEAFGSDKYLPYEPFNYEPLVEANRLVFGRAAIPDYHLDKCDLILSLGADFVETWVSPVKWIRRFAETRVPAGDRMGRFVYAGPRVSLTAINADESLVLAPGDERWLALSLLHVMAAERLAKRSHADVERLSAGFPPDRVGPRIGVEPDKIRRLARSFSRAGSPVALAGAVTAGGRSAVESAVAANLLNWAMASPAVDFSRPHALGSAAAAAQISDFVNALGDGKVQALVIVGANPAYSLPPDYRFAEALARVPTVVSISPFRDETVQMAGWALPCDTPLESWGDYEPEAGIANLMQPVMGNMFKTRSPGDILLSLAQAAGVSAREAFGGATYHEYLRGRWAKRAAEVAPGAGAEAFWQECLRRGGYWSQAEAAPAAQEPALGGFAFSPMQPAEPGRKASLSLWPYPSTALFDGRGANRRWLQELPDVVQHAVWGSWFEIHPQTAAELKVRPGQVIEVASPAGKIRAPAFPFQGVHRQALAIPFGQGHRAYGRYAKDRGANAFGLLEASPSGGTPFPRVTIARRLGSEKVVTTDGGTTQHGRKLFEAVRLSEMPGQRPEPLIWPLPKGYTPEHDIYTGHPHVDHRWAMAVDISRCVGCEACMVACYAENNIAVVGKEWMAQGREMEWIWIDRYYQWDSPHTPALILPLFCQHCDAAPCEPVCPVFAASHTQEGLNAQIYNRCIGTRYCSNNCPYKVRRFNWRNYDWPDPLTWQLNPDVTVRCRGVMEKCTFCVQRIKEVEQLAKKEGRPVRDGEIVPACVQTCPAGVFTFGDLMDPKSRISRLISHHRRRFQLLKELNTKPAVIYLRKVINDTELA